MTQEADDWKPGDPIGYVRPEIPDFELPPYDGERYEALVPDTLDLQERARLAIHAMTEPTDPLADHEPYYLAYFRPNPPLMKHNWWQGGTVAKFYEGVLLMRIISGSDQNLDVDRCWMETVLKSQGPDGLIYTPSQGRPWAFRGFPDFGVSLEGDQFISPFGIGRMLSAMTLFAMRDDGPLWRDAVRRLVDGLIGLAVDAGDLAYFWPSVMAATKDRPADAEMPTGGFEGESSRVPHGLVHAYRLLGYEPALSLAGKVNNFLRRYYYGPDGSFLRTPDDPMMAHFHAHSNGLLAMEEYAETACDEELMAFVVRSFEYARTLGANLVPGEIYDYDGTPGTGLVGYFPEHVNSPEWEGSEICEVADMIALALKLSEAGLGDYWDDADRWIRNMFAEGQLLSTDWIYRMPEAGLINPGPSDLSPSVVSPYDSVDRVPERHLGAFAGWPAANDWYVGNGPGIMQCCTINGARTLYWIWERVLRHQDGKLRLNLLLNRASRWADVESYIPYVGRVEVRVKQPVDLSVRIPEWITPGETRCRVNGQERSPIWDGRYAQLGAVKPGDVVTVTFPIFERTDVVHIEKQRFTLVRKGNEVVSIDPPGRYCPLYQRHHYREGTPRWRKINRFVSDNLIDW